MPVQASDIRLANLIGLERVQAQTDQLTRAASSLSWPEAAGGGGWAHSGPTGHSVAHGLFSHAWTHRASPHITPTRGAWSPAHQIGDLLFLALRPEPSLLPSCGCTLSSRSSPVFPPHPILPPPTLRKLEVPAGARHSHTSPGVCTQLPTVATDLTQEGQGPGLGCSLRNASRRKGRLQRGTETSRISRGEQGQAPPSMGSPGSLWVLGEPLTRASQARGA